jgi:LPS O-antigen subunit length determinant protein (WzzB/FepE family)
MRDHPFTWKTEMWIAVAGLLFAALAAYTVYLHRPA